MATLVQFQAACVSKHNWENVDFEAKKSKKCRHLRPVSKLACFALVSSVVKGKWPYPFCLNFMVTGDKVCENTGDDLLYECEAEIFIAIAET